MITHTFPMDNSKGVKGFERRLLLDTRTYILAKDKTWELHDITSYEFKPTELVITIDGTGKDFLTIEPKAGQAKFTAATKADVPVSNVDGFVEWP